MRPWHNHDDERIQIAPNLIAHSSLPVFGVLLLGVTVATWKVIHMEGSLQGVPSTYTFRRNAKWKPEF